MIKKYLKFWPVGVVFVLMVLTGYGLALKHPLANDELFTQTSSIEKQSYLNLLTLKIPEGNVSPLFYVLQKSFLDMCGFRLPFVWNGDWFVTNYCSQIIMRVMPCLYMSLSITLIFFFFYKRDNLLAGVYALLVALSSYMTWAYWVEARPYSLWFLLSTIQFLLLLDFLQRPADRQKTLWGLGIIHFLLSLTVVFSAVQILAATVSLIFSGERSKLKLFLLTVFPLALCILYYFGAPKYSFFFLDSPIQLFSANLPKDRILLLFILGGGLLLTAWPWKGITGARVHFAVFLLLMILGYSCILALFYLKAHGQQEGFPLSNRYLTGLTPLGIIAVVYFTVELWQNLKPRIGLQGMLGVVVFGFLAFRLWRTWELVRGYYHLQ